MCDVAAFLYGQVLLWCFRFFFPVAPVGDFLATHAVWVSPRCRQEVTTKRWRANTPTIPTRRNSKRPSCRSSRGRSRHPFGVGTLARRPLGPEMTSSS